MTTKALHEIFTAKAGISSMDRHSMSDMATHFDALREYGQDCSLIHELGVREIGSSWAFLAGLADRGNAMVIIAEDRRKLEMSPITALISIDHVHPDKFGGEGTLAEFQKHARENNVHHEFIESSSLDVDIENSHCIFFDTDHTYKQLSQELHLHGNKSQKYLLFHDTIGCAHEIVPAINEFLEEYPEWIVFDHSLDSQGMTSLARMSVEQYHVMKEHQERSKEGEDFKPQYEDKSDD